MTHVALAENATEEIHEARERLLRVLYLAVGIGAVIFGALLAGGAGGFLAQRDQLVFPFGTLAIVITVVLPASFIALAFIVPIRVLRIVGASAALGFIALQFAWVPLMLEPTLVENVSPWLQGFTGVHATIAAIVWQHRWVWAYGIAQGPIVAITQMLARDGHERAAVLDGLGGMLFCLILMAVALAVVSAADRQDAAAARARGQASIEASRRTREREQSRINAIVHDDVMSVLLTASRQSPPESLGAMATSAIQSIETLTDEDDNSRTYAPEEVIAVLRSTVSEAASHVDFSYELEGNLNTTAPVVAALTEALGEAIRNSVLHAGRKGEEVVRSVRVTVSDKGINVVAHDDGAGFSMRAIPERRLGIRVSILERMRALEGGDGTITSRPGRGTTVTLLWTRP